MRRSRTEFSRELIISGETTKARLVGIPVVEASCRIAIWHVRSFEQVNTHQSKQVITNASRL